MKRYSNLKINIARTVLFFAVLLLGTSTHMYGQVLDSITPSTWSVSGHSDIDNGKDYTKTSVVELSSSQLKWGALPFAITGSSGSWDKQTNIGKIDLSVTMDTSSGTVTIKGDNTGITILLDLIHENGSSKLLLQVNNVEYK